MGKERIANAKSRKNDLISSVKRIGREPSVGKILDGTEFVRQRNILPLRLSEFGFGKEIKSDGGVGVSGIENIVEPT